jgi:hypothetical protein
MDYVTSVVSMPHCYDGANPKRGSYWRPESGVVAVRCIVMANAMKQVSSTMVASAGRCWVGRRPTEGSKSSNRPTIKKIEKVHDGLFGGGRD